MDAAGGPVRGLAAAVRTAFHFPVQEGADRSADRVLHHLGQLWVDPAPAAGAGVGLVVVRLVRRWQID